MSIKTLQPTSLAQRLLHFETLCSRGLRLNVRPLIAVSTRTRFGDTKIATDLVGEDVRDFSVARDGFDSACCRVHPE